METFFSEYGYRPHVTGVFGHRKRNFSNTLSRVESFEIGDVSYSCGRAKTEVFKYVDVIPRFKAWSIAHTIRKRFRKYPATCGWSNTIQKRYVWTQIFFLIRRKKSPFAKIPGCVWTRPDSNLCSYHWQNTHNPLLTIGPSHLSRAGKISISVNVTGYNCQKYHFSGRKRGRVLVLGAIFPPSVRASTPPPPSWGC